MASRLGPVHSPEGGIPPPGKKFRVLPDGLLLMIAEDREYIDRVLSGDVAAFDGLVRKYNRMAGAIAFGIVGEFSSADDVVQEALLKAYRDLGKLRDRDKFKVWLAGIVRSQAIDWLRRRKVLPTLPFSQAFPDGQDTERSSADRGVEPSEELELHSPGVEEQYAQKELREKVLEAIRNLPEDDRVMVTLKHMEGLSYKEIAELVGTTVSAVESRLFRARQELRKKLEQILR
jgi:RNA polymerase sigma-70 factor, ECF subfamily